MAKNKKDKILSALYDKLDVEISISCSKCHLSDNVFGQDENQASESFYDNGWRATDINTYCPACAKKYLKSKS